MTKDTALQILESPPSFKHYGICTVNFPEELGIKTRTTKPRKLKARHAVGSCHFLKKSNYNKISLTAVAVATAAAVAVAAVTAAVTAGYISIYFGKVR